MRLKSEFIRLPLTFDAARLAEEVAQFDDSDWRPHPQGHRGNWALPLVSLRGDPNDDDVKGPMRPTPHLERCPYLREVLASLRSPIGRTRLMRIDGNAEATPHRDMSYYWMQRVRVHVPAVTDPAVRFICGARELHMAAGEAWIFDTLRTHNVINPNPTRRIHLVADTVGSGDFWRMVEGEGERQAGGLHHTTGLEFEEHNFPVVMSPEEQARLVPLLDGALSREVERFLDEWREVWHRYGESKKGWPKYREVLENFELVLAFSDEKEAAALARYMLIDPALNPQLAKKKEQPRVALRRIGRPVFIVSSPRAGSSLLFETLAKAPGVFAPPGESHRIIEGIKALHPSAKNWESNRLTAADATPAVIRKLERRFLDELRDRDGDMRLPERLRMLEKTPKNALRIPFLKAAFPEALFIYLYRDPRATMSSMIDAWRSGKFATYPHIGWSLLLTPGWLSVVDRPLNEVVAHQWETATRILLDDLEALPADSWCVSSYDQLVGDPQAEIERLCRFVGFNWDRKLTAPLPLSRHTLTPPSADKAERNGAEIDAVFDRVRATAERAREAFARVPLQRGRVGIGERASRPPRPGVTPGRAEARAGTAPAGERDARPPFGSIHTNTFPELLSGLGASLLVSTYQSGRVVVVRADGDKLNTHLVAAQSPMGIAVGKSSLAIGTARQVWDYRSTPALAGKLDPKHDACFAPRRAHVTGDIRVHEVAFDASGELWLVNTRFSALCTLDGERSFVPRWKPPFVSALAAEDRCHLNGLAMIDGTPRYVTALGISDERDGWREKKAAGGVLMDIASGAVVAGELSMPHSPRWYAGRMWILESGKGTVGVVDLKSGRVDVVAQLPGFTRGLAFAGNYAFVGLSQVRESVFEGIPLAKRLTAEERACGVWAIDVRSGQIVAFLKFEGNVQEIFDVQVLHGVRYPELLEMESDVVAGLFDLTS